MASSAALSLPQYTFSHAPRTVSAGTEVRLVEPPTIFVRCGASSNQ